MKNHLAEVVDAISRTFKKCCPSHVDSPYHIDVWHEGEENTRAYLRPEEECMEDYLARTGQEESNGS